MLLCANPFVVGPLLGEASVLFLFVRVKFGWTPFDYGVYACFKMTIVLLGTLVSMAIFCHWLQLEDSKIGVIACSFQTIAYLMYSCVNAGWAMYIVPFLELMLGAGITVHKSIVSKLVPNSEMGQVTAILSMNEAIVPLIVNPMYNKLYQYTLSTMPGAFYYLGASLAFPGAVIFWYCDFSTFKLPLSNYTSFVFVLIFNFILNVFFSFKRGVLP
ncbi:Adenylate cyclase [Gryllus bimaculatus]|nr:Adenylate cyclase [Gryllus bimaculatus]